MADAVFFQLTQAMIVYLCPVLICVGLISFAVAICVAVHDGVRRLRRLHQIPCSRCAYFTQNYHLKCTVHPCKALSEDAIGCLDFEPTTAIAPPFSQPARYPRIRFRKRTVLERLSGRRHFAYEGCHAGDSGVDSSVEDSSEA